MTQVTAINTFYDPGRRWRELRAIAESMQSEVFLFRTRTGIYCIDRSTDAEDRRPEQRLLREIQHSRIAVVQLAGLTESAFARNNYSSGVYCHGQNKTSTPDNFEIRKLSHDAPIHMMGSGSLGVIDDHSPMCAHS